ncbi:MAG TPA: sodium:solute symporter family protein [Phycisphaerae bacterium]|nr:sodium:solute symporter family protein [Phycisphaerae bacterium]
MSDLNTAWMIGGLAVYLAVVFCISLIVARRRRAKSMFEFFSAGRSVGSLAMSLTMFATLFSAFTMVGMPGFFYTHGVGAWGFVVFGDLALAFVFYFYGIRVVRLAREHNLSSPIELLWVTYRSRAVTSAAVIIMSVFIIPLFAIQIAGMGKLLAGATAGNIPYWAGAAVMLAAMSAYSLIGGLRADIWTDVVQGIVMLVLVVVVCWVFIAKEWAGSIAAMFEALAQQGKGAWLSLPGPAKFFSLPALISFFILFLLVPVTFPQMVTRFYATKSEKVVARTMIAFPLLTLIMFIPAALIGLGATTVFDLKSGDLVMGEVLRRYVHPGVAALFAVGVIAAAMSTADSVLLAIGSVFARDVYAPLARPEASEKEQMWAARGVMLVLMVGGLIVALEPPNLIVQLSILSLEGMAILAPVYIGSLTTAGRSPAAAISSIVVGFAVFLACEVLIPRPWLAGFRSGLVAVAAAGACFALVATIGARRRMAAVQGGPRDGIVPS